MSEDDPRYQPLLLRDVLTRLIRRRGLAENSAAHDLDKVWKQVVGIELGHHSKPRRVLGGVLEIVVTNSAVLEQLRCYLHQSALEQIQTCLPQAGIRSIRYVRSR